MEMFKVRHEKYYGSTIGVSGRGESVAQKTNYCEIDPNKVDKYGVPTLRFNYKWTDNEIKQAKHMQDTFEEIIHNMGGAIPLWGKPGKDANYGLNKPGWITMRLEQQGWVITQKHL